jgi:hypothetical protein
MRALPTTQIFLENGRIMAKSAFAFVIKKELKVKRLCYRRERKARKNCVHRIVL